MTTQQEVSLAVMEHTNNECEVKEDTKQVAEMRSENPELQQEVQNLKEKLEKANAAIKELEKVSCSNASVQ